LTRLTGIGEKGNEIKALESDVKMKQHRRAKLFATLRTVWLDAGQPDITQYVNREEFSELACSRRASTRQVRYYMWP